MPVSGGVQINANRLADPGRTPERGDFMKYRATAIISFAIIAVLAVSYFFFPEVTASDTEMRSMRTFGMIFTTDDSVDENGDPTIVNNVGVSIPDRLENALKDQIFIREGVMSVYNGLQSKLANAYNSSVKLVKEPFKQLSAGDETTAPDGYDETDAPVTVPVEGFPDEYYDLKEETPEAPATLDYDKYPGYGFARLNTFPDRQYEYSNIGSFALYNGTDYVGAKPSKGGASQKNVQKHVDQYEALLDVYPNLKFYSYFVTQIQDTPWFTNFYGAYPDKHELIAQYLPEYVDVARLTFKDFADYQACYYKSDHHWAYKGSERGYQDVYNMMSKKLDLSPMKYPIKTWNFSELNGVQYRGSRANNLRDSYTSYDEFIAYEYELGERTTFVLDPKNYTKEIPVTMGLWERYKVGNINKSKYYDHYICFYGHSYDATGKEYADSAYCFVIKNANGAAHSLLMVCDSTQRPYRDVLGSHFKNVVTLDYRIMTQVPVDYLIDTYDIDVILCGGQTFAWSGSNSYLFSFSENFGK